MNTTTRHTWTDLDFKPAPTGWQLHYYADTDTPAVETFPMPGWIVRVESIVDTTTWREKPGQPPIDYRERTVSAAVSDPNGDVVCADAGNLYRVTGPGEQIDPEDMAREWHAWHAREAQRLAALKPA